tara:strand:- start:1063 stop:1686 length:624 start_codon:yes stop_codon:yes gene_type:complete
MNQKNSLGLNLCFKDEDNPIYLFKEWFDEAVKSEINDPDAAALSTISENGYPTTRMVLLKDYSSDGFVFYTNLNSDKSKAIINSPKISMCFHWKSLLRQVRILGLASKVSDEEADEYFNSRSYESKIGAWASNQSFFLKKREDLFELFKNYKKKFSEKNKVPRPDFWSGWRLKPVEIEFWLNGESRLHERLKYIKFKEGWKKILLNP